MDDLETQVRKVSPRFSIKVERLPDDLVLGKQVGYVSPGILGVE